MKCVIKRNHTVTIPYINLIKIFRKILNLEHGCTILETFDFQIFKHKKFKYLKKHYIM